MLRFIIKLICIFLLIVNISCDDSDETLESIKLKSGLIDSYIKKAKDKNTSIDERKENLEKAYTIYSTLEDNSFKIEKIHEMSFEYYALRDMDNYKLYNEKALKLSRKINDSLYMAKSYFFIGLFYRNSNLEAAFTNFHEADKIYSSLSPQKHNPKDYAFDHGKTLVDLAQILRKTKDYSESESLTVKAIKKFELSGNHKYLTLCYINLGIVAKFLERYEESVEYNLKAIEYAKGSEKEISETLTCYNNIGTVYKDQSKFEKAKEYYHKALSYETFLNKDVRRYARLIDNLAYANFLSGDMEDIPDLFYKALRIRDSIKDKYGIATNTLHLAEYHKSTREDSIAKMYAERSLNASLELQNNEELLQAYQLLSEVSDGKEGLGYAHQYIALNDSLIKEERLSRDKFARIRFETDEIAQENQQISRENQILIIAILGLTALFLLGYIIFRQQQSNKELLFAQTQQESNEEIYRLLLNQQIKLEEGRQLEQQRMSEELHDGVLGRLFGVRLSLDGINQRANDGFTETRNKYIDELKAIEKEIRLISHDLGAETLPSDVAYIDAVENLIKDLCEVHNIEFEFNNDEDIDWEGIDDQKKVNFFRILQESMQNIFKHAHADHIKINFEYVDSTINLTILDDGIGFRANKVKKGIGLKNITSRVSQMNGEVQFLSNEGSGTTVSVRVPIEAIVEEVY